MPLTIRRHLVDRVRQWRKIAYALCAGLVFLAGAAVFLSISSPASSVELASDPTFFNSDRAFRTAQVMSRDYPERSLGSDDAGTVVNWFLEKLPDADIAETDVFQVPMGDEEVTLRNVAVVLEGAEGASSEVILIAAPRDTPPVVKVEPLAYTSGSAILLELIQVFYARPHQKTLVFLSTEDGSGGGLGIDHFLDTSSLAQQVSTILSIQGLGKERTTSLKAGVTGFQNTTPGWYLQLVSRIFANAGLYLKVPGLLSQAADHALSLSSGDQVAGLRRDIASLRLYDDGVGNPTAAGLATQGAAIERLVLSLDAATEIPGNPGTALLLKSGRYVTEQAVTFLAVLMLLPTLSAFIIWLFSSRMNGPAALRHLRNLLSFALPLGIVVLLMYVLAWAGLIPLYRFQVPTTDGPSTDPRLTPTLILILAGAVVFVISRRLLGYLRPKEGWATREMARLCMGLFSVLVGMILMLAQSPFLLIPCLTAAWTWPLATCFAEPVYTGAFWRHRLTTNVPLLLLGLISPVALYVYLAVGCGVGWSGVWWFLIVQTVSGAYGVLGPLAVVFITAGFALLLGVKRMRVIPIETLEVTDELSLLEPPAPRARRKARPPSQPPLSPWR